MYRLDAAHHEGDPGTDPYAKDAQHQLHNGALLTLIPEQSMEATTLERITELKTNLEGARAMHTLLK